MASSSPSTVNSGLKSGAEPVSLKKIEFIDLKAQQRVIRKRIDAAITRVLDHGQYIMGPEVAELETQLAAFAGVRHAVSCASGTDALLMAMMAWGIGPGDAILVPDFTYTATPETVALLGATPVFVDVSDATFNVDPAALEAGIETARRAGLNPRGLIAVDLFGLPADYAALRAVAKQHDLFLLADAAQSFGASTNGQRVGSLGDITTTSFFPAKPLGCYGDGGAIFTDDDQVADVMRSIRLHGKGDDKYDVVRVGINGRLDTIQAAILLEKLSVFPDEIAARDRVAAYYAQAFAAHPKLAIAVPPVAAGSKSVWAQYTLRILGGAAPGAKRDHVMKALAEQGIPTNVYYPRPLHAQPAYAHYPVSGNGTPTASRLPAEVLSLPMHPYLTPAEQDRIVAAVVAAL
jgi:dTDP-4-amino-4,6-dideoxygalactose transaminase